MLSMKARESPRFLRRKAGKSGKVKSTSHWRRLYWCHRKLIFPRRNEAANVGALSSGGVEVILRTSHIPCVIYNSIGPGNELSDNVHGDLLGEGDWLPI